MREFPSRVLVRIEVPRGSFVKRSEARGIEFLSPVPCPFNYGCVPGRMGGDGDPLDALVLGPRLGLGAEVEVPVVGVVRFLDDGREDDKLVCGEGPPRGVAAFFRLYAWARWSLNLGRGRRGRTAFLGYEGLSGGTSSISNSGTVPGTGGGS